MATERDPERAIAILRAWPRESPNQPIIAIYSPATKATSPEWIFYQGRRAGDLAVSEEAIQRRGQLDLRRDGPDDTWQAYPK